LAIALRTVFFNGDKQRLEEVCLGRTRRRCGRGRQGGRGLRDSFFGVGGEFLQELAQGGPVFQIKLAAKGVQLFLDVRLE